jgi:hypothetical protein
MRLLFCLLLCLFIWMQSITRPTWAGEPAPAWQRQDGLLSLTDGDGQPVPLLADTASALILDATLADAEVYFKDRAGRGFNAIVTHLLETKWAATPPLRLGKTAPFLTDDLSKPNPAYFEQAREMVRLAGRHGLTLLVYPFIVRAAEPEKTSFAPRLKKSSVLEVQKFARYLAETFRKERNLVWMPDFASDADSYEDKTSVIFVSELDAADPQRLLSAHGPNAPSRQKLGAAKWVDLHNVYSHAADLKPEVKESLSGEPPRPVFLLESTFEHEGPSTPELQRRHIWEPLLAGACGVCVGSNPVWCLGGPGSREGAPPWLKALDTPQSRAVSVAAKLLPRLQWPRWPSTAFDLEYLAEAKAAPAAAGRVEWIDPANGRFLEQTEAPGPNSDGGKDWLRLVRKGNMFPLTVSQDNTHLVDASGRPFLIIGDTAWSLIAQLGRDDMLRYLNTRQSQGYNALIVSLAEAKFSSNPPMSREGLSPFLEGVNLNKPNPAYLNWAREALQAAGDRGLAVFLCPAYLGWDGGPEGFAGAARAAGPDGLRRWGAAMAEALRGLDNIIWMPGGDYSMPEGDRWLVNALADGIRSVDKTRLMTGHAGQKSPREAFGDPAWLQVDNTYSYNKDLTPVLLRNARREPRKPVFLSETIYEGEHESTPGQIRRQFWWTGFCGHCGHVFGNHPIWHFDGPGLFPAKQTWQQALTSQGSRDMARWGRMMSKWPWWNLQPAPEVVKSDETEGVNAIACAVAEDQSMAALYLPEAAKRVRSLSMSLPAKWRGRSIAVEWWAPTDDGKDVAPTKTQAAPWAESLPLTAPDARDWVVTLKPNP